MNIDSDGFVCDTDIMVSVCLVTYNHSRYVKQAVDSILCQKVNFKYELLISDDASTDDTQKILYDNYNGIDHVRLFLLKENTKCKHIYDMIMNTKGKYICFCEGDDYWIGMDNLQFFVDWMEMHQDYVGVSGRRINVSERTDQKWFTYRKEDCSRKLVLDDLLNGNYFDLTTGIYRNFFYDNLSEYRYYEYHDYIGDLTLCIYILLHGNVYISDKIEGVYRCDRIKGGSSYNASRTRRVIYIDHMKLIDNLEQHLLPHLDYSKLRCAHTSSYMKSLLEEDNPIKAFFEIIKYSGVHVFLKCVKLFCFKKMV